jgi:superfamily II DNA or RNA helicase
MDKLSIEKVDEVHMKVHCDAGIAQELSDFFTFKVPGCEFMPAYRNKMWDGKIRLFNMWDKKLYVGLLHYVEKFCETRGYLLENTIRERPEIDRENLEGFLKVLKLPFEPREYQVDAILNAINNKRMLLLSPTGSGKSFIIYGIIRYILATRPESRVLLVVPTTSLVAQMKSDFKEYGINENWISMIYQGMDKNVDNKILISTWQSIYKEKKTYFEKFDVVIGDEAHNFKAKSLTNILEKSTNAQFRIGTTGTLDGTKTHKLVLEGLFGQVERFTTTKKLMKENSLAKLNITCLQMEYPEEIRKLCKKLKYSEEIEFLITNEKRNNFIKNLALTREGNTLVLFQMVEKHGDVLYKLISESAEENRKVFYVHGGVDTDTREEIRAITEKEENAIIIASYGTFSTGINIRNLYNIVFASPSKSRIRNLQSIGRGLRLRDGKTHANLYDIGDNLSYKSHRNFTLDHMVERIKTYNEEKFEYKIVKVNI